MPHLALHTFGVLKSPLAGPAPLTREFHVSGEAIYRKISQHPGYLAHAEAADGVRGAHFDLDWGAWGEFAVPTWYGKGHTVETTALAATLGNVVGRCRSGHVSFDAMVWGALPHDDVTGPDEGTRGSTAESHELQRLE